MPLLCNGSTLCHTSLGKHWPILWVYVMSPLCKRSTLCWVDLLSGQCFVSQPIFLRIEEITRFNWDRCWNLALWLQLILFLLVPRHSTLLVTFSILTFSSQIDTQLSNVWQSEKQENDILKNIRTWPNDIRHHDILQNNIQQIKTLRMKFSTATFSRITFSRIPISRMTISIIWVCKIFLNKITISRITFSRIAFNLIAYSSEWHLLNDIKLNGFK
jgi:hypothetical protein